MFIGNRSPLIMYYDDWCNDQNDKFRKKIENKVAGCYGVVGLSCPLGDDLAAS